MPNLVPHPTTPCPALRHFEATAKIGPDGVIVLTYRLKGDIEQIALPEPAAALQTDGLWQHTCFECFARVGNEVAYKEFNFAPSTAYAAYSFTDYRDGIQPLALDAAPSIEVIKQNDELTITTQLPDKSLPKDALLALTAVIELKDGSKSYWSLKHADGKPDFHHKDGFVLKLQ